MVREVEGGEACGYKDDASIDPDVALSYIGDKVQSILGHHQKDFEGEVSATKLGAKFGGYGSFLPMHQRSPVGFQSESPQRIQNPQLHRSSIHVRPKDPIPISLMVPDAPSSKQNDPPSPSVHASKTLKNSSNDDSIKQHCDKVSKAFLGKVNHSSSNSANPLDQSSLKVCIKVGPDKLALYNAEIYNLGLTSSSSSEENSYYESDEFLFESHETPDESPANVLQIMASFPVSGGLLLSPLNEDLMKLNSVCRAAPQSSAISIRLSRSVVTVEKKTKCLDERRKSKKSGGPLIEDLNDNKQKILGSNNLERTMQMLNDFPAKPLDETATESEKDVPAEKRKGSKDKVKGRVSGDLVQNNSLEHASGQQLEPRCSSIYKAETHPTRITHKDISMNHASDGRTEASGNHVLVNDCLDNSKGEGVKGAMDTSYLKGSINSTSCKENEYGMARAVNILSSRGENKPKRSHNKAQLASKADSFGNSSFAASEYKYSGRKDVNHLRLSQKDVVHTSSIDRDKPSHFLERFTVEKPRNSTIAPKSKSAHADKLKGNTKNKENLNNVIAATHVVEPPNAAIHTWVCCDLCEKWRLLPYGTTSEQLCLPEMWVCSMLNWLPGRYQCDISEDETTNAVHALYPVPVPEIQHNFHTHADGGTAGVVAASVHNFVQNNQDQANDQMKKQKPEGKQNKVNVNNSVPSGGKKNLQCLAMKTGNSKEVKQSLAGVNATKKIDARHPNKSAVVKSNKRKDEFLIGDDANPRKKIQKRSAQDVEENMEGIKSKDANTVSNFQTSSLNSGSSDAAKKDGRKNCAQKDVFSMGVANIQICVKKQKDQMQDLPDDLGYEKM